VLLSVSAGCGYQFTVEGTGPVIGGGAGIAAQGPPVRLALHTFKNNSFEPNLEFKYTKYFRQAMQSVGGAEFVDDEVSADFILEGAILSVTLPSLAFTRTQTRESRVLVKAAVSVKDRKTGKVRWSETGTSSSDFFVGAAPTSDLPSGLQFNRVLQDRAIEQAGQLLAADLADRFLAARDGGKFQRHAAKDLSVPVAGDTDSSEPIEPQGDFVPQQPLINYPLKD